jgi:hypothetical protein
MATITVKADKTGKRDAGRAIRAALKKAKPGDYVSLPKGSYAIGDRLLRVL